MTEAASWAGNVPSYSTMRGPLPVPQWDEVSQNTLDDLRLRLRESVTESILMALKGAFIPGPLGAAFDQLSEWASLLLDAEGLLAAINGEYEGENLALQAIEIVFAPIRLLIEWFGEPLVAWLNWLWKLFANITPNPAPTGPGADILVPIFTLIDDVWDMFTAAAGNLLEDLFKFLNWLWRRFANIPGENPPPTGPGFDLLVPIFSFLDDVWDAFTTATGNLLEDLFKFGNWLWRRFANIPGENPPPTGPGFDLLVPIFSLIDDVWDAFTTATGNLLEDLFKFANWLWRLFTNTPGPNPEPTGPAAFILVPLFKWLDWLWEGFGEAVDSVLKPVFNWLNWLWKLFANITPNPAPTGPGANILVPLFEWLDSLWESFGDVLENVFAFVLNVFKPVVAAFSADIDPSKLIYWFLKILKSFLPFVPWQALLPSVNWTAVDAVTRPGDFPALITDNLFAMFNGLLGGAAGAFKNFLTNLGAFFAGMPGLTSGTFNLTDAVKYFLVNILKIASEGAGGVLQFGGDLISAATVALGDFFVNLAQLFGIDLREPLNWTSPLTLPVVAWSFLNKIKDALLLWLNANFLGGAKDLIGFVEESIFFPIASAILGGLGIDPTKLGIDPTQAGLASIGQIASTLLTNLSSVPAEILKGFLPPGVLGQISLSAVADISPNLITLGQFAESVNIEAADGWTWDGTNNVPGSAGGSARLDVAPAKNRFLYSRQAVPVSKGDRLVVSASIITSGLTLSGAGATPISIALVPFIGSVEQPVVPIGNPRAGSATWVSVGNTAEAPYVVTDTSGWTSVIVRLAVSNAATGGTIWWDRVSLTKTGKLEQGNVDSLIDAWNQMIGGLTNPLGGATNQATPWLNLFTAASGFRSLFNDENLLGETLRQNLFGNPDIVSATLGLAKLDANNVNVNQFLSALFDAFVGSVLPNSSGKTVANVFSEAQSFRSSYNTEKGRGDTLRDNLFGNPDVVNASIQVDAVPELSRGKVPDLRDTIDAVQNALSGGSTTNNAPSAVKTFLENFARFLRGNVGSGSNLLADPGAERSAFWNQAGLTHQTTIKRSSTASLMFTSLGATTRNFWWNVNDLGAAEPLIVKPGDIFQVECWVYSVSSGTVSLAANCSNSLTNPTGNNFTVANVATTPSNWVQLAGTYTIPSGFDRVRFGFQLTGGSTVSGTTYYVDDMLVRENTVGQTAANTAQSTLDNISLGITGTGSGTTPANIATHLQNLNRALFRNVVAPGATGTIDAAAVPELAGATGRSKVPELQAAIDNINRAFLGGTGTGYAASTILTRLQALNSNLWGVNTLGTTVQDAAIPTLTGATGRTKVPELQAAIDHINQAFLGGTGTGNAASTILTRLQALNSNLWGVNTLGTTVKDSATPAVSNLTQGWRNASYGGFTSANARETTDAIRQASANLADQVAKLTTAQGGAAASGNGASVSFSTAAFTTMAGAGFAPATIAGDGALSISNGAAVFSGNSNPATVRARYTAKTATSVYQKVAIVFAGADDGRSYIYARMNSTSTAYIYAWFQGATVQIGYNTGNGVETSLGQRIYSGSFFNFSYWTGGTYWLECGVGNNPGSYRVLAGDTPVLTVSDISNRFTTGTTGNPDNRWTGFGGTSIGANKWAAPIGSFAFYDNVTPATVGSGFRVSRKSVAPGVAAIPFPSTGSTGTATNPGTRSPAIFPGTTFDTAPDFITSDYTWASGSNGLTVKNAGWYQVSVGAGLNSVTGNLYVFTVGVRRNSIVETMGGDGGPGTHTASCSAIVYCNANDVLYPVFVNNFSGNVPVTGHASGNSTYFSVSFLNNTAPA